MSEFLFCKRFLSTWMLQRCMWRVLCPGGESVLLSVIVIFSILKDSWCLNTQFINTTWLFYSQMRIFGMLSKTTLLFGERLIPRNHTGKPKIDQIRIYKNFRVSPTKNWTLNCFFLSRYLLIKRIFFYYRVSVAFTGKWKNVYIIESWNQRITE